MTPMIVDNAAALSDALHPCHRVFIRWSATRWRRVECSACMFPGERRVLEVSREVVDVVGSNGRAVASEQPYFTRLTANFDDVLAG